MRGGGESSNGMSSYGVITIVKSENSVFIPFVK